ncbi:MAG: hypothetical protein IPK16_30210 [Anaerolineales bacterium]|nr:hypothetical protein [Anaerolineales bacterium]
MGYDAYAFSTDAGPYQIALLLPSPSAVDRFRKDLYPGWLETVTVEPAQ